MPLTDYPLQFNLLSCCVIIPTYNNAPKLVGVVESVLNYTSNVIIVNDGSTDETASLLASFQERVLAIVSLPENKGKGNALLQGFNLAFSKGFQYAITIDSDGQHLASDLPLFLEKIKQEPHALIVGARNMGTALDVPKKSSFGHNFSNFWYKVETGISLPDTQSGFRLYPLAFIQNTHFWTKRFEFEVEVIVKAAWKGINVTHVAIQVLYPKDRITHFRPVKDFAKISLLNAVLVFLAIVYYRPVLFIRTYKKKSFRELWDELIWVKEESVFVKSMSAAYGVFCGISPFWGFHTSMAIGGAIVFRLNKAITLLTSNVSFPPFIPLVLYLSLQTGAFVLNQPFIAITDFWTVNFKTLQSYSVMYFVGSMVLSCFMALVVGLLSYFLLSMKKVKSYD